MRTTRGCPIGRIGHPLCIGTFDEGFDLDFDFVAERVYRIDAAVAEKGKAPSDRLKGLAA